MVRTDVLIVGAGPTGLMMACQLAMRNISFRIIDKTDDHTTQSRALVIHARSLEIFQQMGIAERAIQQGKIAKAANLLINGNRKLRFALENIGNGLTNFPFLLMLEQSKTETLLLQFLNSYEKSVERNKELVEFHKTQNGVIATIKNKNGEQETIEASWLVGADGAHSVVREYLQIPFLGKTYEQSLFVLDCEIDFNFPTDEMYISFSAKSFAGLFPLTNGRWRVISLVPKEYEHKEAISFDDVNKNFASLTRLNITLRNPHWISKYHSHHRVVSAFRKDRCFLTGDAAHIHSPVGAQGMNTGLQDAYNLAWKLALVIQKKAPENLLDSYGDERIEIAKKLVKTTDKAFHFVTNQSNFSKIYRTRIIPSLLKLVLPVAEKFPFFGKLAFRNISEIALHYRNSNLSKQDSASSFTNSSVKPGDRLPYNSIRKNFITGTGFHLLIFSKTILSEEKLTALLTVCKTYNGLITIDNIPFNTDTLKIYKQFGISDAALYLIRPDSYIAYRTASLDAEKIKNYLQEILNSEMVEKNVY